MPAGLFLNLFSRLRCRRSTAPPFYDMRIVDEDGRDCPPGQLGEIIGRGPITMAGYVNRAALTSQTIRNGWVHTGDLGRLDEEGYLLSRGSQEGHDRFRRREGLSQGH